MRGTWLSILLLHGPIAAPAQEPDPLAPIRALRLRGELVTARALAEQRLARGSLEVSREVGLRLELARIHDRVGLHHNTRPVAAAMEQVDAAAAALHRPEPALEAAIGLARAELLYRAEMGGGFPAATAEAQRAAEAFRRLGDRHGEAESVHLLGLIHLQRRELGEARAQFDRSLALDCAGGERPFFRGEYERHVGFVALFEGDTAAAVRHFERSLALRREAGAVDPSLFASLTLAGALLDLGRAESARAPITYATTVAAGLDSPFGRAQLGVVLGRLHARTGQPDSAAAAFREALRLADSLRARGVARQAGVGLEEIGRARLSPGGRTPRSPAPARSGRAP